MTPQDLSAKTQTLQTLLSRKLGVRATTLQEGTRRAGRMLPRHIRTSLLQLHNAEMQIHHPKQTMQVQTQSKNLNRAYKDAHSYLKTLSARERRKTRWIESLGGLAFSLLLTFALILTLLRWRGLL